MHTRTFVCSHTHTHIYTQVYTHAYTKYTHAQNNNKPSPLLGGWYPLNSGKYDSSLNLPSFIFSFRMSCLFKKRMTDTSFSHLHTPAQVQGKQRSTVSKNHCRTTDHLLITEKYALSFSTQSTTILCCQRNQHFIHTYVHTTEIHKMDTQMCKGQLQCTHFCNKEYRGAVFVLAVL